MLRREKPRLNSFREFLDIDALQEELQVCVWANCQTQSARVPRIDASRSPRLTHADHAAEVWATAKLRRQKSPTPKQTAVRGMWCTSSCFAPSLKLTVGTRADLG